VRTGCRRRGARSPSSGGRWHGTSSVTCRRTRPAQDLAPTGRLRAAINLGNPVLAQKDPARGELGGISVDLARELDRRARARGRPVDVLVQVNVGQEPSKGGWPPEAVETAVEALAALGGLRLRGLMAIPPAVERAEDARGSFRALRKLAERHGLTELSMGMSGDFEIAVEEGATMVRVGTAIFGPRPPRVPLLPER